MRLQVESLVLDTALQPRNELNADAIQQYAEDMRAGDIFPSVDVLVANGKHYVTSGWHRVLAAKRAGIAELDANITTGNYDDAVWAACAANKEHDRSGSRRTNADKKKAVEMALKHPNAAKMSDGQIARHIGVSGETVRVYRARIFQKLEDASRTVTRNGVTFEMNTANIGQRVNAVPPIALIRPMEPPAVDVSWVAEQEHRREEAEIQVAIKTESNTKLNKVNENIEWAGWSWNPVTGCLHDCPYCYARDIANRFYPEGFQPSYHPDRLTAPDNTNVPTAPRWDGDIGYRNIFTCSMADLFGKWVPIEWIESVLETIRRNPQWTFLLLSKFPVRMAEFTYPDNVWLGTTVDRQYAVHRAQTAFTKIKSAGFNGVCWLSCEPMLERLTFDSLDMFDWVVMGGSSKSTQTPEYRPPFDDIVHLYRQARRARAKVYQKTNLIPGMSDEQRIREYPEAG